MTIAPSLKPITSNAKYISDIQFGERIGCHRTTVWRRAREEADFPKPVKLSRGCARWRLTDIEAWEAMREMT